MQKIIFRKMSVDELILSRVKSRNKILAGNTTIIVENTLWPFKASTCNSTLSLEERLEMEIVTVQLESALFLLGF